MTHDPARREPTPSRRDALKTGAGVLAVAGLGPLAALARAEDPTPGTTQGPYWVDELLNRSDIRTDPSNGQIALGFPVRLTVNVSQLAADGTPTPLPDAIVDIWHCNAVGVYSDVSAQNTVGQKFLRGYQVTDRRGTVRFVTIYPGWYSGRTVHIHARVRVYDPATDAVTYNQVTQFFFDDQVTNLIYALPPYNQRPGRDTLNAVDMIYNDDSDDDGDEDGHELQLAFSAKRDYAVATFNFYLDLSNGTGNGDQGTGGPPDGGPPDGGPPPGGNPPPPPPG